jgi:hypothetical protein
MAKPDPTHAERKRRLLERRRRGVVAVAAIEVLRSDIGPLVRAGYLSAAAAANPTHQQLAAALEKLIEDWTEVERAKAKRDRAHLRARVGGGVLPGCLLSPTRDD